MDERRVLTFTNLPDNMIPTLWDPSGDPTPSPVDVKVTEQIVAAGKLLEIEVLDHLVVGERKWVSFVGEEDGV